MTTHQVTASHPGIVHRKLGTIQATADLNYLQGSNGTTSQATRKINTTSDETKNEEITKGMQGPNHLQGTNGDEEKIAM